MGTIMKKYILYTLMLLSTFSFSSCKDEEDIVSGTDREWMTMFICDNNRGKGDDYAITVRQKVLMVMIFISIGMV